MSFLMPRAHTHAARIHLRVKEVKVSAKRCILKCRLVTPAAFISDITQSRMLLIKTAKKIAFKIYRTPPFLLCDDDSRDIEICWPFLTPGFNTGLCQFTSPSDLVQGLAVEGEREQKREAARSSGFTAAGPAQP